jgi:hypothetical protein
MRAKRSTTAERLKKSWNQPARAGEYRKHTVTLLYVFKIHFSKKETGEIL